MPENKLPDYGLDAPAVMRNLLIADIRHIRESVGVIERDAIKLRLVPFPIINIVFGGQSQTERRPESVPLYGIPYSGTSTRPDGKHRDSLSMTVRAESKCPMRKQYKNIFGQRH